MTRGTGATAEADLPTHPPSSPDHGGDGGRGPDQATAPRRRRWWIVALVVVAVAAAVAIGVAVLGDDDGEGEASTTPTSTPVPDEVAPRLDGEGEELAELLALGHDAEVHAVYEVSGEQEGTVIEMWRKDGLLRQDTHLETEAGSADTAGFLLEDGKSISCSRRDAGEWTCSAAVTQASPDGIFGTLLQQLGGLDVEARDGTIDGRDVRCFAFGATDGEGEMCVTTTGIPARATVGDASIELIDLETTVDDGIFEPPAEIAGDEG